MDKLCRNTHTHTVDSWEASLQTVFSFMMRLNVKIACDATEDWNIFSFWTQLLQICAC